MAHGVSEGHIADIVSEVKLKELKEFVEHLGTYDMIALYKYLQMRRNVITIVNSQSFKVGSYAKVFDVSSGKEFVGKIADINGANAKLEVDGIIYKVSSDMLYE